MYTHNKDGELGTMKRKLLDYMQITDRKVATEAKEVEMIHTSEERSHTPKESGRMNMGFIFPNDKTQAESAYYEIGEWPDYTNLKITPGTPKWNVVGEFFGICRGKHKGPEQPTRTVRTPGTYRGASILGKVLREECGARRRRQSTKNLHIGLQPTPC